MKKALEESGAFETEKIILVGVSGGPDSQCLAQVLHRLGLRIAIAHFDHMLRPEAEGEAQAVGEFAKSLGAPFVTERGDVRAFADKQGQSIEEAARTLRYRFLFEQAGKLDAQAVAVGHNADDQVETMLMHLLRGAGMAGLKGMRVRTILPTWSEEIPLLRPLLPIWRSEIEAYCEENGLVPLYDQSNLDTAFFRNRLRHELIPELERYNPQIRQLLWQTAAALEADYDLLESMANQAWGQLIRETGEGYVELDLHGLRAQPLAVRRSLLRRAAARLRPEFRDVDYAAIERGIAFAEQPSKSGEQDWIAGLRLAVEGERLWVAAWESELPASDWPQVDASQKLTVPGQVRLAAGWRVRATEVRAVEEQRRKAQENPNPYQAWLDADRLKIPLFIRPPKPGDRFEPLGMGGHSSKVSDFFINTKLPQRARGGWPLVCSEEEIVWVPGFRLAEPFRVRPETRTIVRLTMEKTMENNDVER